MSPTYTRAIVALVVLAVVGVWFLPGSSGDADATGAERYSLDAVAVKVAATFLAAMSCYVLLGGSKWKLRLARAVSSVVALLLALLLLELPVVLGWVDYRVLLGPKVVGGEGPQNRQLDRELIFHRPPLDHFTARQPGDWTISLGIATPRRYEVEYRYDANGFRNSPDLRQADVVLLGDSFVEGYNCHQKDTCAAELARILDVKVANLGQADYGPPQELVALKKFGFGYRPRVVVWFFFEGNDLCDLEGYGAAQHNWEEVLQETDCFTQRSFLRNALSLLAVNVDMLRREDSPLAKRRSARLLSKDGLVQERMYFELSPGEITAHELSLLKKTQDLLRQAKEACDRRGVKMLVVNVPIKFRVYGRLCEVKADSDLAGWQLNDLPDRLRKACQVEGLGFLDLTPALEEAASEGAIVYLLDDGHWSARGHAVVAREIADWIRRAK